MKTDLNLAKQASKILLKGDPIPDTSFPELIVHHPYFHDTVLSILENGDLKLLDSSNPEDLDKYRQELVKVIDKADHVSKLCMLIDLPYRMHYLTLIRKVLSEQDLADCLRFCWTTQEFPNFTEIRHLGLIYKLFKKTSNLIMDKDELSYLDKLPDKITIFRGQSYNLGYYNALSWTDSYDVAKKFAHRFNSNGKVFKATINKRHIAAYFQGENELIVDPTKLKDVQEIDQY